MIISHKLKTILIAPRKVGIASFIEALKKYCGEDSVISAESTFKKDKFSSHLGREKFPFSHIWAQNIKQKVPDSIWSNYLKISIIRCPYDAMISFYFYTHLVSRGFALKSFVGFILHIGNYMIAENFSMLCIDKKSVVDFIIRYENSDEDIKILETKIDCIGLLNTYQQKHLNKQIRLPEHDICKVYSKHPIARAVIDKYFSEYAEQNELIQKYYPLYKERLSQKIPEPGYFSRKVASLLCLICYSKYRAYMIVWYRRMGLPFVLHSTTKEDIKLI